MLRDNLTVYKLEYEKEYDLVIQEINNLPNNIDTIDIVLFSLIPIEQDFEFWVKRNLFTGKIDKGFHIQRIRKFLTLLPSHITSLQLMYNSSVPYHYYYMIPENIKELKLTDSSSLFIFYDFFYHLFIPTSRRFSKLTLIDFYDERKFPVCITVLIRINILSLGKMELDIINSSKPKIFDESLLILINFISNCPFNVLNEINYENKHQLNLTQENVLLCEALKRISNSYSDLKELCVEDIFNYIKNICKEIHSQQDTKISQTLFELIFILSDFHNTNFTSYFQNSSQYDESTVELLNQIYAAELFVQLNEALSNPTRVIENFSFENQPILDDLIEKVEILTKNSQIINPTFNIYFDKVLCHLLKFSTKGLETNNSLVFDFLTNSLDILTWINFCNLNQQQKLIKYLVKKLIFLRMLDPFDQNYKHISNIRLFPAGIVSDENQLTNNQESIKKPSFVAEAKDTLSNYNENQAPTDEELFTLCNQLEDANILEPNSEYGQLQVALIESHRRYKNEQQCSNETIIIPRQADEENIHNSVVKFIVSTFQYIDYFKSSDVSLLSKIFVGFTSTINNEFNIENVENLLINISNVLSNVPIESIKNLDKNYFKPLAYILDKNHINLPSAENKIISLEKLKAIKKLYWGFKNWKENSYSNVSLTIASAEIVHSLLVLTEQEQVLIDWFGDLLHQNKMIASNINPLVEFFIKSQAKLNEWFDHLTELDEIMNLASFEKFQGADKDKIQRIILKAIELIIQKTNAKFEVNIILNSNEVLSEIDEYIDFDDLNPSCGMIRYNAIFIIAAMQYEKNNLIDKSHYLLNRAFSFRFIHQLSAVQNLSQLTSLIEELHEPLLEGNLGIIPQVLSLYLIIQNGMQELHNTENLHDFCSTLINKIQSNLPGDWELTRKFVSYINTVLNGYSLMSVSARNEERIIALKKEEQKIAHVNENEQIVPVKEQQIILRLFVTAQYLNESVNQLKNSRINFKQILVNLLPITIIWEQHDIAATVIFAPKLISKIYEISNNELTIANTINPIVDCLKETDDIIEGLCKNDLIDRNSSAVCSLISNGKNFFEYAKGANDSFQKIREIFNQLNVLKYCKNALAIFKQVPGVEDVTGYINNIVIAIENGTPENANEAILKLPQTLNLFTSSNQAIIHLIAGAGKAVINLSGLGAIASIVDLAATVYYGEKILHEIRQLSEQMEKNHQEMLGKLDSIKNEIISHQQYMLETVQSEFRNLNKQLVRSQDLNFDDRMKDTFTNKFEEHRSDLTQKINNPTTTINCDIFYHLIKMYGFINYPKGLLGDRFDGSNLSPESAIQKLFLIPIFNISNLPNLNYWLRCCNELIYFLNHFVNNNQINHSSQVPVVDHIKIICKTYEILQALKLVTTKDNVLRLLEKVLKKTGNEEAIQNNLVRLHQIAYISGLPLHQFGENNYELWQNDISSLSQEQQKQKDDLEKIIFNTIKEILNENDYILLSPFIIEVENLLNNLICIGAKIHGQEYLINSQNASLRNILNNLPPNTPKLGKNGFFSGDASAVTEDLAANEPEPSYAEECKGVSDENF